MNNYLKWFSGLLALSFGFFLIRRIRRGYSVVYIYDDLPIKGGYTLLNESGITDITVHHYAGTGSPYKAAGIHVNERGWNNIAYKEFIDFDGTVYVCLPDYAKGNHNGTNNSEAIGICLNGDFTRQAPTEKQIGALIDRIKHHKRKIKSIEYLMGHKEYRGHTACPGRLDMDFLRRKTNLSLRPDAGSVSAFNYSFADN